MAMKVLLEKKKALNKGDNSSLSANILNSFIREIKATSPLFLSNMGSTQSSLIALGLKWQRPIPKITEMERFLLPGMSYHDFVNTLTPSREMDGTSFHGSGMGGGNPLCMNGQET